MTQLVDNILDEWKIPLYKIFGILTDNGSNILAAFKHDLQLHDDEELSDDTPDEVVDVTNEDNDSNENEETAADDALGQDQQDDTADYEECEVQHDINLVSY